MIDAGDLSFRELGASSIRLAKLAGLDIRVRLSSVVMISSTTKDRGAVIVAERNSVTSRDGHRKIARLIAAEERRAQWKELKP